MARAETVLHLAVDWQEYAKGDEAEIRLTQAQQGHVSEGDRVLQVADGYPERLAVVAYVDPFGDTVTVETVAWGVIDLRCDLHVEDDEGNGIALVRLPDFEPQVVQKHDPVQVQWIFHVVPKTAQVMVDGKHVGGKLTLPYSQTREHHILVLAPGFQPITMNIKPTTSQTFELHLTREERPARPQRRERGDSPARVHDAAPVQDL